MAARRFIVTTLIETTDGSDPTGYFVHAVDFGSGGYVTEVLESSAVEIAPWSDGTEDE